jgi:integrase
MARGSIRKVARKDGISYEVVVDLGHDSVTGKRRQRTKRYRTKRDAHTALTAWLADIDKGTAVDRSQQTVAELMHYWLDTYARHNVRPTTYEDYSCTVTQHIVPAIGAVPVQKLTAAHLQQFYAEKLAAGSGPRTVQLCHLRLRQALAMAEKLGLVTRNAADAVMPPRVLQREMTIWTPDEAQRFLRAALQSSYGPIWLVLLATGMRRGEVLGLRWQDVDLEHQRLHVRQCVVSLGGATAIQPPKSRAARRVIPVDASLIDALREHRIQQDERKVHLAKLWQDHDLVFASDVGTPINPRNLDRDFHKWVERAGVPRIRIHDIRHTVVTMAIASGSPIKAASIYFGHAKTSTTMDIYTHGLANQGSEVAQHIQRAVLSAGATRGQESREVFVSDSAGTAFDAEDSSTHEQDNGETQNA